MCTECGELTTFLSINFFDVAHTSGVGESLFGPVNLRVDGVQHVSLDGCVELNVAYDLRLLVLVDELGIRDVLCLRPLHSRFTIVLRSSSSKKQTTILVGLHSCLGNEL